MVDEVLDTHTMRSFSIVIPAFNESAVIGDCIEALMCQEGMDQLEIVVIANGCADDTAAIARGFGDRVTVLELEEGSKIQALNAGDEVCTIFPRAYLDADVELGPSCLARCHDALAGGQLAVAPRPEFISDGCGFIIRAFYEGWERTPYFADGHMIGSGFYAMSREGRARFDRFPLIISDDGFAHQLFKRDERSTLQDCTFKIHAPRTLQGLVAIKTRERLGAIELRIKGFLPREQDREGTTFGSMLWNLAKHPISSLIYATIRLYTRNRATRQARRDQFHLWERDTSSREAR